MVEILNFSDVRLVAFTGLILLGIIFLRYLIIAGGYHFLFFRWLRPKLGQRFVHATAAPKRQMLTEIAWSGLSTVIFAASGLGMLWMWQQDYTAIYTDWTAHTPLYTVLSLPLALFLQDTYYYWVHRWMHLPKIYPLVHRIHHQSIHTSVFTSFSFHPIETVFQALIVPLLVLVLPLHLYLVGAWLIIMTLSATINHAGVEVYPGGKVGRWFASWIIGATHHDQHHHQFRTNYGLYFTFWDRWMNTESKRFREVFNERIATKKKDF